MGTRCETEGKHLVSIFRSLVAKELVKVYKLTQVETAKKIGATQAAVSQYLCSKRGRGTSTKHGCSLLKIQRLAKRASKRLANGETNWERVSLDFCKACSRCFKDEIELTADHYVI